MNLNDLLKLGAQVFQKSDLSGKAGSNLDPGSIIAAITGLTGGKGFDIGSIINKLDIGGLGDISKTWLGDGTNGSISPNQVVDVMGKDKIADFAAQLGLSPDEAAGGLSEALPQMIDKGSSGGSLLDSLGGMDDVIGLAGKLFGR